MKSNIVRTCGSLLVLFYLITFASCDLINPEETLPTTIHIEPFEFQIQSGQGTSNQRITEVWVYGNSNFIGAFTPPTDVIFLEEGLTEFTFRPGIRNNGILDAGIVYPLFTAFSLEFNAQPGAVLQVNPVTRYRPEAFFSLLADFELSNEFVDNHDTIEESMVIRSSTDVFEGQFSGEIILTEEASYIEVTHAVPMGSLPTDGTSAYLEFRYKSEVPFRIGLLGINLQGDSFSNYFYLATPKEDWNMLYIELNEWLEVSQLPAYKILFSSGYPTSPAKSEYRIFLDNIKVVHL